jgi:hypothetical protein
MCLNDLIWSILPAKAKESFMPHCMISATARFAIIVLVLFHNSLVHQYEHITTIFPTTPTTNPKIFRKT